MGMEKEYKFGVTAEFHLDGTEKFEQTIKGMIEALNMVSKNRGFEKYWKSQHDLMQQVERDYARYQQNMSDTSSQEALIKSVNALKAIAGGDVFDGMTTSTENAFRAVKKLSETSHAIADAYSPERFRTMFQAFQTMQDAGLETSKVLRVLGSGANVDNLNNQLELAKNEAAELSAEIVNLQNELANSESGKTIQVLKNQIADLQKQIEIMVFQAKNEFDQFLNFANINPESGLESLYGRWDDSSKIDELRDRISTIYEEIKTGGMSAKTAIAAIKSEFAYLLEGGQGATLGDFFNSPQIQEFLTKFETMCTQIESLTQKIGANIASMFTEAFNNPQVAQAMSNGFNQALNTGSINNVTGLVNALTSKLDNVDGQTDSIIGDFKEILTIVESISKSDLSSLDHMSAAFESLKSIGKFEVDSKSLEQLKLALEAISQISNVSNLSYLKNITLDGFKDLKISKASMNNLSEHLSIIAKLDINKLQGLNNIDLRHFNDLKISKASMEALSGFIDKIKDLSQYSNELNNIAQILQSSASKIDQLQNTVSNGGSAKGASASANNLAEQTSQFVSSKELLDKAAQDLISKISSSGAGTTRTTSWQTVEDLNNQNHETRTELENVIKTIQDAKGEIDNIKYSTRTVWGSGQEKDEKGIKNIITATEKLTGAVVTYRNELGQTIQTQYKWQQVTDANGNTTNFFGQGDSRIVDSKNRATDIAKLNDDKLKYISKYTIQLERQMSEALDSAINKPLSAKSQNVVFDEMAKLETSIQNLNKADASNFLEQTLRIEESMASLVNHIRELRNADNVTTFSGTSNQQIYDKQEIAFRNLKFDIKEAGVESEKLTRLLNDIQSVIDKGANNATSEELKRISKEINTARTELESLKKVAKSGIATEIGKNLGLYDVKDKVGQIVQQNYTGGQAVTPSVIEKGNITKLTYQWEDEQKQVQKLVYEYNKMTGALKQISHAQSEVKKTAGIWETLKQSFKHLGKYLLTFGSFYRVIGMIRQGFNYVKELDTALTEMRKVSDETVESLKRFQKASFDIADSIGTTSLAIQNSTTDFMRLGYSIKEAQELAQDANIYANVGDMDIDTATEHMISSIKAWESEFSSATEASIAIIDKYNEIGNNFAITSADIGEAMERASAALKAGGNTLDESLGLITAGNLIQQDAETTANALKVLSLRIRGSKTELEDLGESTDDLASSTSKLRGEIKALTGVDIMLDDDTYKSTAQIIKEIGAVWDKLTDVQQANVLEKLAGKTRASVVAGLLENYKTIEDVEKAAAEESEGSATEENEKRLDSMQGKISQLKNHWIEFWNALLQSEHLKKLIDLLDVLVQGATKLVNSWALMPTLIAGIAIKIKGSGLTQLLNNFSLFSNAMITKYTAQVKNMSLADAQATLAKTNLNNAQKQQILINAGLVSSQNAITLAQQQQLLSSGMITAEKLAEVAATLKLTTTETGALVSKKALNAERVKEQLTGMGVVGVTQQQILSMLGLAGAEGTATVATTGLAGALNTLKAAFLSNPITFIATALLTVGTAIYSYFSKVEVAEDKLQKIKDAAQEAKNEIEQLSSELEEKTKTVDDIKERYAELAQEVENLGELSQSQGTLSTNEYEEFLDLSNQLSEIFPTLTKGYIDNGNAILDLSGNVDTIVNSLNGLVSVQDKLAKQEIIDKIPQVWTEYAEKLKEHEKDISKYRSNQQRNLHSIGPAMEDAAFGEELLSYSTEDDLDMEYYNYIIKKAEEVGIDSNRLKVYERGFTDHGDGTYTVDLYDFNDNEAGSKIVSEDEADRLLDPSFNKFIDLTRLSDKEFKKLMNSIYGDCQEWSKQIELVESKIASLNSEMGSYINLWLTEDWNYKRMDEGSKKFVSEILMNTNWIDSLPDDVDKNSWEKVSEWLENNVLYAVNNIDNTSLKTKLSDAYQGILTSGEILDLKNKLISDEGMTEDNPIINYLDSLYSDTKTYERYLDNTVGKLGEENKERLSKYFSFRGIDSTEELNYFNEVTDGAETAEEAILMYEKSIRDAKEANLNDISDTVKHLENQVKPALDSLGEAYREIFTTDGFTLENVGLDMLTSIREGLSEINKNGVDIDNSDLEEFVKVLSTTEITMDGVKTKEEEVQKAFDNLVTKIIEGSDAIDVNSEAYDVLMQSLKDMGVTNAEKVFGDIKKTKEKMTEYGYDLKRVTSEEATAFLQEAEALGISTYWFKKFTLEKEIASNPLNTTEDIKALENLCNALGASTEIMKQFERIKQAQNMIDFNKATGGSGAPIWQMEKIIEDAKAQIKKYIEEGGAFEVDFSYLYNGNTAGGANSTKEYFDWIEVYISRLENKISNFGKTISATYKTWSERNQAIKGEYATLNEELQAQINAKAYYENKASQVKLSGDLKKKVREGKIDIDAIDNDTTKQAIQQYREYWEKALEAEGAQEDIRSSIANSIQESFDLIQSEFDSKIGELENRGGIIDALIEQQETDGHIVSTSYYKELTNMGNQTVALLEQEYARLNKELKNSGITEGTEMWYDLKGQISEVEEALINARIELIEYDNKIREINWEVFDKQQEAIERVREESEFFIDLMEEEDLFEKETGAITEYGKATMGLHAFNYNAYLKQAKDYGQELAEVNKELQKDPGDQELIDRREELLGLQRDVITGAQDEKNAMIDLAEEGFNVMLEALEELIEKRKEALDAEKNLYDFQKKVADQTKTIASLEKQLAAYRGDDSEETRAKIQQIKVSLEEAKQNLKETEYDQWRKDQEQMLDALSTDTQEWINERLDHEDELMESILNAVDGDTDSIKNTLQNVANDVGYQLSEQLPGVFGEGGVLANTNSTLTTIANYVATIAGGSGSSSSGSGGDTKSGTNTSSGGSNSDTKAKTDNESEEKSWGSWFVKKVSSYPKDRLEKTKDTSIVDRLAWLGYDNSFDARTKYFKAMGGSGVYTGSSKQNTWMLSEMKKRKGYAKGASRIKQSQMAWTQENGQELIYRASDGAMLTPLGAGDAVFTSDMTNRLWNLASNPDIFSNLASVRLPKGMSSTGTNGAIQNDVVMNISLPNVVDVDGFVNELRTNKRFEKVVQSMTIGNISSGSNSLSKFKY